MDGELLVANGKGHDRELVGAGVGGEDVTLLRRIIRAAWDGIIDSLAEGVIDQRESRPGISDSSVA